MNTSESLYAKWMYKFIKIDSSNNREIIVHIKTKKGVGDTTAMAGFNENELQQEIKSRRKYDDITVDGAKELLKAFDELRNYKLRMNIPLDVKETDILWSLANQKPMTIGQKINWMVLEVVSILLPLVYIGGMLFLIILVFRACN